MMSVQHPAPPPRFPEQCPTQSCRVVLLLFFPASPSPLAAGSPTAVAVYPLSHLTTGVDLEAVSGLWFAFVDPCSLDSHPGWPMRYGRCLYTLFVRLPLYRGCLAIRVRLCKQSTEWRGVAMCETSLCVSGGATKISSAPPFPSLPRCFPRQPGTCWPL
jgi:hypothetical protein